MSLIVLASDKGSPGVTTTAVALAGVWPRRAILAECDPAGGDLVYRAPAESGAPLNPNIGMLSLATTARHGLSAHQLEQHIQRMHGGLELVVGLATGDQSAGLTGLWPALGRAFDGLPDTDVIADCGRVDATSPALELMAAASLVVLIARTSAEQIAHVRDRALSLLQRVGGGTATAGGGLGVPIGVVLIVDPKQRTRVTAQVDELLRTSGLPVKVIGTIADDPDGADLINGRGRGRLDRTLLIRSTREVALDLSRIYGTPSQGPGPGGGGPMPGQGQQQQYAAPPMQQPVAPPRPPQTGPGMADPRANRGARRPPEPTMANPGSQQPASQAMGNSVPPQHMPAPPAMTDPVSQQPAPGMAPVPQQHMPAPPAMGDPMSQQPAPGMAPQHHISAPPAIADPMSHQPAPGMAPVPQQHMPAPPAMTDPVPQQPAPGMAPVPQHMPAPPAMTDPVSQQPAPGMAPVPQQHMPAPPAMTDPAPQQPAPPAMTPVPQHHIPAPSAPPANGYPPPAQGPGGSGTAKKPMFRRNAQPQPTVWPGEQPPAPPTSPTSPAPPAPPPSAHEGFTSVTLGGGPDPRGNLPYQEAVELERLPPRDEIAPGRGGHRAGPPQGGQ
jgi:hypothetical protein